MCERKLCAKCTDHVPDPDSLMLIDHQDEDENMWLAQSEDIASNFSNFVTEISLQTSVCECVFSGVHSLTPSKPLSSKFL